MRGSVIEIAKFIKDPLYVIKIKMEGGVNEAFKDSVTNTSEIVLGLREMQGHSVMVLERMEVMNKNHEYSFMLVIIPVCLGKQSKFYPW